MCIRDRYKSALSEVEGNIGKLDSALTELYQGNLQAAIEFANAQTTISLGEMQIASAESGLDSAQKQLEAGEEQIKSGQEQLDAGVDQIKEGYDQINDNAEQLADASVSYTHLFVPDSPLTGFIFWMAVRTDRL